jgi:sec-independent protein translocase protein TatC
VTQQDIDATEAPLLDHLIELRKRLIWCIIGLAVAFAVSFAFSTQIFNLLILPFKWGTGRSVELIQTELLGFFFVKLKIGFFGAMFVTFPLIAIQIYRFVAPGLYSNERNAFRPYLIATPIFFLMGAALVYFGLLPVAIQFFYALVEGTGGEGQAQVQLMPDVRSYLDFVMMLILAFGLCFQLPVILTLLGQIGVVSYDQLRSGRKFAIVGVFAVAAILTPPDPISQIAMAVPLMALYEVAVQAVRFLEKRRAAAEAAKDAATL